MLYCVILCHVILCYIVLYCVILCYVILCYSICYIICYSICYRCYSICDMLCHSRPLSLYVPAEEVFDRPAPLPAVAEVAPTSDSLVTLISQALQSGDDGLLEQCLGCSDHGVVEESAKRLPAGRIVAFLRKLVAKFEKRPSRGMILTRWLSSVLRHHTSLLVSVPDLSVQLAGLGQMLEQRLSSHVRLSSLAGRLDLLLAQVGNSSSSSSTYSNSSSNSSSSGGLMSGRMKEIMPMQVYREE